MLKLSFYGAAGEVTGSCYLIQTDHARVLLDLGMFQGGRDAEAKNAAVPPVMPATLDAVVLTHGHLDHVGRMPLLSKNGYRGRIFTTSATIEIGGIVLRDAAHIQASDAEHENKWRQRQGEALTAPLYTPEDAERAIGQLAGVKMETPTEIAPGITVRFIEAGHILGAAEVHVTARHGPGRTLTSTIMFSGDIGVKGSPIVRDPTPANQADFAVMESTYGDRDHKPLEETRAELLEVLRTATRDQGKVLIPAFAVGRTQDLLYHIGGFIRSGELGALDVVVDSPMATEVGQVYARHTELYDEPAQTLLKAGVKPLTFPGLRFTRTREESAALNNSKGCSVIIAASGMCTGGRIVHHLRHQLWKPETHVVIVGYQGVGTPGRALVDGARHVRVSGEPVVVRAKVHTLGGFSAHAGQGGLIEWARPLGSVVKRLFLTHGEDGPRGVLRDKLAGIVRAPGEMPRFGEVVQLA